MKITKRFIKPLAILMVVSVTGLFVACGDDNGEGENNDDPELGDVVEMELFDRDDDEVTAYVHDDHWHGTPFLLQAGADRRSIGFRFLDADEEQLDIPLGEDGWDIEVDVDDDDLVDIENHGDHVHLTGLEPGETDLYFDLVHDGETQYAAPGLNTLVQDADADPHEQVVNVELIDRSDDSVLVYSDGDHWHGGLDLHLGDDHTSVEFRFLDGDDEQVQIPLGSDGFDYDIHGYDSDIVYVDTHSDHFHIEGEQEGHTDLHIEFTKDGEVFYEAAQGDHLHVDVHDGEVDYESIVDVEILDRNDGENVLVYSDGDHWHGGLDLDSHACSHESLGFRFLDDHGDEVHIHLGSDGFDYDIHGYDSDVVYLDTHSDHFHLQGEMEGHTDLHIEFTKDGQVFYEAADGDDLHVDVDAEGYQHVTEVDLLDRNDDDAVLAYSDGDHWHGSLELDVDATEHESIGFRLLDDAEEEVCVPLGDHGFSYDIHGYDSDVIYLDTHSDHFHIQGEQVGHTDLHIEFTRDGDLFYEAADGDHLHVDVVD